MPPAGAIQRADAGRRETESAVPDLLSFFRLAVFTSFLFCIIINKSIIIKYFLIFIFKMYTLRVSAGENGTAWLNCNILSTLHIGINAYIIVVTTEVFILTG